MIPLVCPRCRRVEHGELLSARLGPDGACACGARHPVVGGIPVVFRDPEDAERACVIDDRLVEIYRDAPPSPLTDWLAEQVEPATIELGSGLGHPGTLALDSNLAMLLARGDGVCADALDPPFPAECASTVVLANVLDSIVDPFTALAQADALVRPGGRLIVTCAYAFAEHVTPRQGWFSEQELRGAFGGRFGPYEISSRLIEERELEWRLRPTARTEHVHRVHVLVGEKPVRDGPG